MPRWRSKARKRGSWAPGNRSWKSAGTRLPKMTAKLTQPDPRPGGQRVWAGGKGTAPGLALPRKNTSPENLVILRGDAYFPLKRGGRMSDWNLDNSANQQARKLLNQENQKALREVRCNYSWPHDSPENSISIATKIVNSGHWFNHSCE